MGKAKQQIPPIPLPIRLLHKLPGLHQVIQAHPVHHHALADLFLSEQKAVSRQSQIGASPRFDDQISSGPKLGEHTELQRLPQSLRPGIQYQAADQAFPQFHHPHAARNFHVGYALRAVIPSSEPAKPTSAVQVIPVKIQVRI